MSKIFYEILNKDQKRIFPQLKFLTNQGFYLAGGTALALQLKHRTSLDFDFYTRNHFSSKELLSALKKAFPEKIEEISSAEDTLFVRIDKVSSSFFWYKYRLISPLVKTSGPSLASLGDIAAMKLIALTTRARIRDYIDIFFLIKELGLPKMFAAARKKYPLFNPYIVRRALTFFNDIEQDEGRIEILDKNFSWEKAKEKIFAEVKKYQLAMLKSKAKT